MGSLHVFLTTVVCFHGFCASSSVLLLSCVCSEVFASWQDFLVSLRACVRTLDVPTFFNKSVHRWPCFVCDHACMSVL